MKSLVVAAMLLSSGLPLLAQPATDLFRGGEVSLDLFGTLAGQCGDEFSHDGRWGAGAGLNYFFSEHLGVGADAFSEDTHDCFIDRASGSVFLRIPFEPIHLAPYGFGGGGRQFDPSDAWFGQVGVGVDVRLTSNWGLFVDGRYMFLDDESDEGLGRVGLRVAF